MSHWFSMPGADGAAETGAWGRVVGENSFGNSRTGNLAKRLASRLELAKLRYYKRNPLERRALELVSEIYAEEEGPVSRILLRGERTVLFGPGELLNVWHQARIMAGHGGAFAEVGVFRGGSAKLICGAKGAIPLHLFDTFAGLPDVGRTDARFERGMFAASAEAVRLRLSGYPDVHLHPGLFPATAMAITDLRFSFVHLDVDLYQVTKDALEFFYPRMLGGGRILSHDYGQCEGVWRAFDEFAADRGVALLPMEASQVLLVRC